MARQITEEESKPKVTKSKGSRGASKKAYFAMGPTILARNQARRAKRVVRRKAYWDSPDGQSRKFEKMNTPVKLKKMEDWKLARAARRRVSREAKPIDAEAKKD